jgi:hypothetical protein
MEIKLINGKWLVNSKSFAELTPNEIIILDKFFADYKEYCEQPEKKVNN